MTALRLYSYREGDRGEYYIQYILSALGTSVPVPRQEDIGIDFYCSLIDNIDGNRIIFDTSYCVQAKSESELHDGLLFGNITKENIYKSWEINWLKQQNIPLLIASFDRKEHIINLYSTSGMGIAFIQSNSPAQIKFLFDKVKSEEVKIEGHGCLELENLKGIGDGKQWHIPLGPPIISINLYDIESLENRKKLISVIKKHLELDYSNLTYRKLGIPFTQWFTLNSTNNFPTSVGAMYANSQLISQLNPNFLKQFLPLILSLAYSFKMNGQDEYYENLRGVFKTIPKELIPSFMQHIVAEFYK